MGAAVRNLDRCPFPLSSRLSLPWSVPWERTPDFLLRCTNQRPRMRLSLRESRTRFTAPMGLTGNPEEAEGPTVFSRLQRLSELSIRITKPRSANPLNFVIPTGAQRRGGTCSSLSVATTLRTLHPNNQGQGPPTFKLCHPACPGAPRERSRGMNSNWSPTSIWQLQIWPAGNSSMLCVLNRMLVILNGAMRCQS